MSCRECGSPFSLSHYGDCPVATGTKAPSPQFGQIEDGFGNAWNKCKQDCRMAIVRPGKAGCDCDWKNGRTGLGEEV